MWCNLDISKREVCLQPLRAFRPSYKFEGFFLPGVAFSTAALLSIGTLSSKEQGTGSSKLRLFSGTFCGKQNCAEIFHVLFKVIKSYIY